MGIKFGVFPGGKGFHIVFREVFFHAERLCQIHRLVVGDGGFFRGGVGSDQIVAVDMDACPIAGHTLFYDLAHAVVGIDDNDVGITPVQRIPVCKGEVFSGYAVAVDAIAGVEAGLHTILTDEEVPASFQDLMLGIKEQVVDVELQLFPAA